MPRQVTHLTSKFRYRFIGPDGNGEWTKAADKTDPVWYAKLQRRHVEVRRRARNSKGGEIRYVAYGFVNPEGKWTYSTELTPDQYLKEIPET